MTDWGAFWHQVYRDAVQATMSEAQTNLRASERLWMGPILYCQCGAGFTSHRIDLKKAAMEDGSCSGFRPGRVRWRVDRVFDVNLHHEDIAQH